MYWRVPAVHTHWITLKYTVHTDLKYAVTLKHFCLVYHSVFVHLSLLAAAGLQFQCSNKQVYLQYPSALRLHSCSRCVLSAHCVSEETDFLWERRKLVWREKIKPSQLPEEGYIQHKKSNIWNWVRPACGKEQHNNNNSNKKLFLLDWLLY